MSSDKAKMPPPNDLPKVVKEIEVIHNGIKFTFQIVLTAEGPVIEPPPGPGPAPTLEVLKIVKVTTSADDGNVGNNMLNADAARWSCKGTNCQATFDLGIVQDVNEVHITFHRGAERSENFDLELSDNGTNWAKISESQQDAAKAILKINPAFKARYIRFTGKGNDKNEWNSIEFVEVKGKKLGEPGPVEPSPGEEPNECPPGQHRDPSTGQCVPDVIPPPPPAGGIIEGGVKMIYPKVGNAITFKYGSSNEGRAQWSTDNGKCMLNQEATAILKFKSITNMGEECSIKLRGGRHSSSNPQEGSCYIIGVCYDGSKNIQWEEPHPNNHAFPGHEDPGNFEIGSLQGKTIAIKAIVYQQGDHDHIECWVDTDPVGANGFNNNYRLFFEHDTKEFVGKCNGNRALIRCDDIKGAPDNPDEGIELLYSSLREIDVGPVVHGTAMKTMKTLDEEKAESKRFTDSHKLRSKVKDDEDEDKPAKSAKKK
jgi:F5/8 type C domain